MSLQWSDLADFILKNYGALIADCVTKTGLGNDGAVLTSPSARLRDAGRVFLGGADANDAKPREWQAHYSGGSAASFGPNDAFPAAVNEQYKRAYLDWKRVGVSMSYDSLLKATQRGALSGGRSVVNLDVRGKLSELFDEIDEELASDGTGNSGKDITGFLAFLSASNTYANIDQATYSWWQATITNAASAGLSKTILRTHIRSMAAKAAFKKGGAELWASHTQYHKMLGLYDDNIRYGVNGPISDAAAPLLYADGLITMPVYAVAGVPSDEIWVVTMNNLEHRYVPILPSVDALETQEQAVEAEGVPLSIEPVYENKDVKSFFLKAYTELVCVSPKTQGRIYGLAT